MAFKNKEEQATYHREVWYPKNKARRITLNRQWKKRVRDAIGKLKLEKGCVDCGYNAHVEALDFDHLHDKSFSIWAGLRQGKGLKTLLAEIEKCEVRCANCHRVKTAERRHSSIGGATDL